MPTRADRSTRAERSAMRRQEFFQDRIDQAGSPTQVVAAGSAYLLAVIKRVSVVDLRKAEEIARDTTEFLLRQANAHDTTTGVMR